MDNIAEQLVAKRRSAGDYAKIAGICLGSVILASFFMFISMFLGLFGMVIPSVLVLFGGIWLLGNQSVEYEYILTNNEMDIDKIIGKRKRKRMITLDLHAAEDFAAYPSENDISADATVYASSGLEQDAHYLVINHSDYGKVKLIFNPNEKMREAIMQEFPNALRIKIKHNVK